MKYYRQKMQKLIIYSTAKNTLQNLNIKIWLKIKFSSVVTQGKKKSCECHTRFSLFVFDDVKCKTTQRVDIMNRIIKEIF